MKKLFFLLFGVLFLVLTLSVISAFGNPAAVYCVEMGYEHKVVETSFGDFGKCDVGRRSYDEWDFFNGKVGKRYSYCRQNGYDIETISKGGKYSEEYAVCVSKVGLNGQKTEKSMSEMMGLSDKIGDHFKIPKTKARKRSLSIISGAVPSSFDWRNKDGKNWMTSVKNQGNTPYCWSFTSIGLIEAQRNIDVNNPQVDFDLSEQEHISCASLNYEEEMDYVIEKGISTESCFSFRGYGASCNLKCSNPVNYKINSYGEFARGTDPAIIKQKISSNGPVSAIFYIGSGSFDSKGLFRCNGYEGGHTAILAGYNDAGGYWIVKNSWGANWNGDGYFKLAYDSGCYFSPWEYVNYGSDPDTEPPVKGWIDSVSVEEDRSLTCNVGNSVGLARRKSDGRVYLDGIKVSSCVDFDFGSAANAQKIKVNSKRVESVCGDSCAARKCRKGGKGRVFYSSDGSNWNYAGILRTKHSSLDRTFDVNDNLRYVKVCRNGDTHRKRNLIVNSVQVYI